MGILTTKGEIKPEALGVTYMHEHLSLDLSAHKDDPDTRFDNKEELIKELTELKSKGVKSLVEVTNRGMGRDMTVIEEVADQSGLQVIVSTGFYKEPFLPDYVYKVDEKALSRMIIEDINKGIDDSDIRAHVIGEVGTSHNQVTEMEEKVFRACAKAHLETGRPISTHTTLGTMGDWQVRFFKEQGVNLEQVIIGHLDLHPVTDYHLMIADYGCYLAFDTVGKVSYQPDEKRVMAIRRLIDRGYLNQILLSQDLTRKSHLQVRGGIGYTYLLDTFIPMLLAAGVTQSQVDTIMIHNPKRALDVID